MNPVNLPISKTKADIRGTRGMALGIILCMSAIYFFAFFQRVAIPGTVFNELQATYTVSAGVVAGLGALYLYIYGGMQLIAGAMNDRFGAVRVLLTGGVLLSAGSLLFPVAGSPAMLYGARVFVALGSSLVFISIIKTLDQLFAPEHFPHMLGVALFIGYAGGLTGTFPFERAVHVWGWQHSMLYIGIATTLVTIGSAWVFRHSRNISQHVNTLSLRSVGRILRNPSSRLLIISAPINFGIYFLMQSIIGKKFLQDYGGMDSPTASILTFIMMAITMILCLFNGVLLRLTGHRRKLLLIIALTMAFIGIALLLTCLHWGLSNKWLLPCYLLLGMSTLGSPISNIVMKELNPPESIGLAIGILNGACYLAVAFIATMSGVIMDHYHSQAHVVARVVIYPQEAYTCIFFCSLLLLAAAFCCVWFVQETGDKRLQTP